MQGHTRASISEQYNASGSQIVTLSEDAARIWDAETGELLHILEGHTSFVYLAQYNASGSQILTASRDGTAIIWDAGTGVLLHTLQGLDNIWTAQFNVMGMQIVTATGGKTARIWDAETGELLHILEGHTSFVTSAQYNASGSQIVTASDDGTAKIWDAETGELLHTLQGHVDFVRSAQFNTSGSQIVTASNDSTARIWDAETGELLHTLQGHTDRVQLAQFNVTGSQIVTASLDNTAKIWDTETGELLHTLQVYTYNIPSASNNATGMQILIACLGNTAKIWDAQTGELLHTLQGHTGWVNSAQFSPSGNHIITTGGDHKTIIWDAQTGKQLYTRLQLKNNDWLVYDEHYRFDGSPGGIDQLYLVCGLEVIDLNQVKDSLYVPGLVSQIMSGNKEIMLHDKPVAKLEDLNICELTPLVEPMEGNKGDLLRYRILPRKGGLGNIEMYINNNLTYTYSKSQLQKEAKTKNYILEINTDTLQRYLMGKQGQNNPIQIKPLIERGSIYGRGVGGYISKTTSEQSPKFIGVFVGVNDYNNPNKDRNNAAYYTNLSYAEADAESMATAMEQSARTLFEDSVLIYRITQESNTTPNKPELEKVFAEISQKAKSEDILYVFFAGHGGIPEGSQNPNGEVRFMLHQASKYNPMSSSFGMSDIKDWMHPQKIKAQKRVLVFDACHSGQFIQDMTQYAFRGDKDEAWKKKQLDKLKDQTGMLILAASADDQSSYEDDQLKHGVMTYHLLKQIKETQQDTTLILDNWFGQSSEGVKFYVDRKYPRSNNGDDAPVQTPQMFGRGDFGVGMVTQEVRNSIQLNKVKTLIGRIQLNDATNSILTKEPKFKEILHEQIRKQLDGNRYEFNPEADYERLGYTIPNCSMFWMNNSSINTYTIRYQGKDVQVNIPPFNTKDPKEIAKKIAESIVKEIEKN